MKNKLTGKCASPGKIKGYAFVIDNDTTENHDMENGQILVVRNSSPEYFVYYLKASAIVTQIGGITCHAASLARDLNIPCVVSVPDAMEMIHTGDEVFLDADKGEIYVY